MNKLKSKAELVRQTLFMLVFTACMGATSGLMFFWSLPAGGQSDFDRGSYSVTAPIFALFFLMGVGGLVGCFLEWRNG